MARKHNRLKTKRLDKQDVLEEIASHTKGKQLKHKEYQGQEDDLRSRHPDSIVWMTINDMIEAHEAIDRGHRLRSRFNMLHERYTQINRLNKTTEDLDESHYKLGDKAERKAAMLYQEVMGDQTLEENAFAIIHGSRERGYEAYRQMHEIESEDAAKRHNESIPDPLDYILARDDWNDMMGRS